MYTVFFFIEIFSPLIPLITLFSGKQKKARWLTVLVIYFILYMLLISSAFVLKASHHPNIISYFILNIISFIAFGLIISFFVNETFFSKLNLIAITVTSVFAIVNAIWVEHLTYFNSNSAALNNIIIICYCLYYYKLQLKQPANVFIERQTSFWIISGIFIYCGGNFFFFAFYNSLTASNASLAMNIWYVTDVLILLMNIFFAKGLKCNWAL